MLAQRLLLFALMSVASAIPASATLVTYTMPTAFAAGNADQTFQTITFPIGPNGASYTDPTTGVVFNDNSSLVGIDTPVGWPTGSSLEATACALPDTCTTALTITLPSSVTSISMDLGLLNFSGFQIAVANSGGGLFTLNTGSAGSNPLFLGFRSDSPFSTFILATEESVSNLTLDNIQVGTPIGDTAPPDTPEVPTMLMIGSGLVMLRFGKRWTSRPGR